MKYQEIAFVTVNKKTKMKSHHTFHQLNPKSKEAF